MKAAVYSKYGPSSVLSIAEVAKPAPTSTELLIKVHYATVNRTDAGFRRANYFISRFFTGLVNPKRQLWGSEFAGEVVEVGADVTEFKVGDKVFGFDDLKGTAHAEYMTFDQHGPIATIPKGFTYKQLAAAGEGATYALNDIQGAGVTKGQNVMVYGASGAIGSAAVQILKDMGVRVTAVCGTKNVDLLKSLGADEVIDYQTQDFTGTKQRFDLVFDSVGKTSYGACKQILKPTGKYCSTELGFAGQNPLFALWFAITGSKKVIFPIPKITKMHIMYMQNLVAKGAYLPVIDSVYPLDQIAKAAEYVDSGQKTGNVLIKIA